MPRFTIDINAAPGQAEVQGQWKYAEGYIPDQPDFGLVERSEGSPARLRDYDDSSWEKCEDISLWAKFGDSYVTGFSFVWYRMNLTVPATVGGRDVKRTRLMFETCVDDYGELWIDGECNRERGTFEGFNRPAADRTRQQPRCRRAAHHRHTGGKRADGRPRRRRVRALLHPELRVAGRRPVGAARGPVRPWSDRQTGPRCPSAGYFVCGLPGLCRQRLPTGRSGPVRPAA